MLNFILCLSFWNDIKPSVYIMQEFVCDTFFGQLRHIDLNFSKTIVIPVNRLKKTNLEINNCGKAKQTVISVPNLRHDQIQT